jgi:hypothetical protein
VLNLRNVAIAAALALAPIAFAPAAFAQGGDIDKELQPRARAMWMKMADKDGMISQQKFMEMVTEKWNMMDKGKKGMIKAEDAARIMMHLSGVGSI